MKRFYKSVSTTRTEQGFVVLLDGKPIKTARGNTLAFPSKTTVDLMAAEWGGVQGEIIPIKMPVTRWLSMAVDMSEDERAACINGLMEYLRFDHALARAEFPADFSQLLHSNLQPLVDEFNNCYEVNFMAKNYIHESEDSSPSTDIHKISHIIQDFSNFQIAILDSVTRICNSLIISLAILEKRLNAAEAIRLANLEFHYQQSKWGEDSSIKLKYEQSLNELQIAELLLR